MHQLLALVVVASSGCVDMGNFGGLGLGGGGGFGGASGSGDTCTPSTSDPHRTHDLGTATLVGNEMIVVWREVDDRDDSAAVQLAHIDPQTSSSRIVEVSEIASSPGFPRAPSDWGVPNPLVGGSHTALWLDPSGSNVVLLGQKRTTSIRFADTASATAAVFDGASYQLVWLAPEGRMTRLRGRTIDEAGRLGATRELAIVNGGIGQQKIFARAASSGRIVVAIATTSNARTEVRLLGITAGVRDPGPPIVVGLPTGLVVRSAEVLDEPAGATFRLFLAGALGTTVAYHFDADDLSTPALVVTLPEAFARGAVLAVAHDHLVVRDESTDTTYRYDGDYSTKPFLLPTANFIVDSSAWSRRDDTWLRAVHRFREESGSVAIELEQFDGTGIESRVQLVQDDRYCQ